MEGLNGSGSAVASGARIAVIHRGERTMRCQPVAPPTRISSTPTNAATARRRGRAMLCLLVCARLALLAESTDTR